MTVVQSIAQQLGGNKFQSMTGATMYANESKLMVKFKGSKNSNCMNIEYMLDDTYTMTFYKLRGTDAKIVAQYADVCCNQLASIFEMVTSLKTNLN